MKEASESYTTLPEEINTLYKRHHMPVPNQKYETKGASDADTVAGFVKANASQLNMQFDAILGSTSHIINNDRITIKSAEESEHLIKQMLHKNGEDKYVALINAHSRRFLIIDVPEGKTEELRLLFLNTAVPLMTHIFINSGNNSTVKIVELFLSEGKGSTIGTIHEIRSGNYSNVELDAIHNENSNSTLLSFCRNSMGSDSKLTFNSFYNGAAQTRIRNTISAEGPRSQVTVGESILGSASQKFDVSTQIVNAGRESNASLDSKAVVLDTSFCIMKGFAKVRKGANHSRSYVHERGIILGKGARVDGLPDMSVDEPEVKATHSSATSPIDPESVFYLMAKGIDELGVRKLIVSGFLGESISKMHNDTARAMAIALINQKLETKEFGVIPKLDKSSWAFGEEREKDMFMGHYKYR